MRQTARMVGLLALGAVAATWTLGLEAQTSARQQLRARNETLLEELREAHDLSPEQLARIRAILERSGYAGQGNPEISSYALSREECREGRAAGAAGDRSRSADFAAVCGAPFMAPLYDPDSQAAADAPVCIDQYEFPGMPCAYPVVWIRANEAAEVCEAMDKRLCDAHEWEGACAGSLEAADYRFDLARGKSLGDAVASMRRAHNSAEEGRKSWSYGSEYEKGICAAASQKSAGCDGGGWTGCGSNTYPTGSFPACRSPLGVYDLNGNAAEHMSLPLASEEMGSQGQTRGVTEMKGSWFIFDRYQAHEDWCRWRAPFWHGSRVRDPASHHNYHLGFRCCKDVAKSP